MTRNLSPRRRKLLQRVLKPLNASTSRAKNWVSALYSASSDRELNRASSADGAPFAFGPIDLSKAKRLKHVVFRNGSPRNGWITETLETITYDHRDFQKISMYIPTYFEFIAPRGLEVHEENDGLGWLDLDKLLFEFWESRSVRVRIACTLPDRPGAERTMRDWAECLLPRLAERGVIDPPESFYSQL
jgi:hypothetical protein